MKTSYKIGLGILIVITIAALVFLAIRQYMRYRLHKIYGQYDAGYEVTLPPDFYDDLGTADFYDDSTVVD